MTDPVALPSWDDYIEMLRPLGGNLSGRGWALEKNGCTQELWRALFAAIAQGFINYVYMDPQYPDFVPAYDYALNLAGPNPDFRYKACLIEGDGSYRISGFRGTSHFVDLTIFTSLFSLGTVGPVSRRISLDELKIDEAGRYEFILSADRPTGYTGDWFELDPRAMRLQVRHCSYDWLNKVDARMAIDRLDRPAPRPRETPESLAAKLSKLSSWAENTVRLGLDHGRRLAEKRMINGVAPMEWASAGGFNPAIQAYVEGLYELADGEALIIESDVPEKARYWSFLLTDPLFATIDWMNHQSSLNGFQVRLDADGRCRLVISMQDPGVPNWLDPAGHPRGIIQVRWNECSSHPMPSVQKVQLAELRGLLPADTPHVTPEARDAQLRRRRDGAQMRNRW